MHPVPHLPALGLLGVAGARLVDADRRVPRPPPLLPLLIPAPVTGRGVAVNTMHTLPSGLYLYVAPSPLLMEMQHVTLKTEALLGAMQSTDVYADSKQSNSKPCARPAGLASSKHVSSCRTYHVHDSAGQQRTTRACRSSCRRCPWPASSPSAPPLAGRPLAGPQNLHIYDTRSLCLCSSTFFAF